MKPNVRSTEWLCISCSRSLGTVLGGEYHPSVAGSQLQTSGPNLKVTCPDCGQVKIFYTSDPVVRALYQLIDAVASASATAMIRQISRASNEVDKHTS
jgi:ribosomal protein S27E